MKAKILELLDKRKLTLKEISEALGKHQNNVRPILRKMLMEGKVTRKLMTQNKKISKVNTYYYFIGELETDDFFCASG